MKLSIVMMIKNESKNLEKCLMSIKAIQAAIEAEIIIVDTGSEDNSVEIAKKYTDKVYFHQWNNDFAAMRNITINYASGQWIFVLDGDEVIEKPEEFINFFQSPNCSKYATGIVRIKSFAKEDETKSSLVQIPRLFRKDKDFKYIGAIHEQPNYKGPIYYFNSDILHYGYISTDSELMERKFLRNTQMLKIELEKEPKNIYYWFQLSQSYALYKKYDEAIEANLMAYEIAKEENTLAQKMYIYTHLANVYSLSKRYEALETLCLEALTVKDGYIDLYYFLALAQQNLEKNIEAIRNYNVYLDMLKHYEDFAGSKDISVVTCTYEFEEVVYANLIVLYSKEKQYEKALECIEKINKSDVLKAILPSIINAFIKLKKYTELKRYYENKVLKESKDIISGFSDCLEAEMNNLDKKEKNMLIDIFSRGEGIYALLNLIRIENRSDEIQLNQDFIDRLEDVNFNKLPNYYGEIFYYLLRVKHLGIDVLKHLSDITIESYFANLIVQFKKECTEYLLSFLQEETEDDTLDNIRIRRILRKVLLLSEVLYSERYEEAFRLYLKDGIDYIKCIYNEKIILEERIWDVKNDEEAMFIYMSRAKGMESIDKAAYIRYLRKAIEIYPPMASGINIYIKKLEDDINRYKEETKEQIKAMIDTGSFLRAQKLIHEYEKYKNDDVQIFSMKAVIAIMESRLDDAETIIKEGLKIEENNFDLLYNLKYVFESQGEAGKAEAIQEKIAHSMPTKRSIDPSISLEDFFERIKEENIRYVILKWSEELPNIQSGKNLSILVHDEDLVKISKYFIPYQAEDAILCEVFSITGVPGGTDAGLPQYPVSAVESIIDNRVLYNQKFYIPCSNDFIKYFSKK